MKSIVARGVAAFVGIFTLGNLAREQLSGAAPDLNVWWIGVHWIPSEAATPLLFVAGLLLFAFAFQPEMPLWRKWLTSGVLATLIVLAAADAVGFWSLEFNGRIHPHIALPLSLLVVLGLGWVLLSVWRRHGTDETGAATRPRRLLAVACALGVLLIAFPLAQMFLFGTTDYCRRADCAVVFGARAYADGRPSVALADRVRTACQLYQDGWVKTLVFSGGPGDGDVHETECMRQMALGMGIPDNSIILDRQGLNTRSTVEQTCGIFKRQGMRRIIAVSHFYHLPRVKLAYQEAGIEVYTVPARETYTLTKMPLLMAREVAAWWAYWIT
jgi:vancomycin permeability regulator SanA